MPEHIKLKLTTVVKYLPACLFALYALLIFFFSLAPVITIPDFPMQVFPKSVYELLGVESPLRGTAGAVVAFAVISLVASFLGIALLDTPFFDLARAVKGNSVKIARFIFKFVPCLFYFIFFILACVMFGKVAEIKAQIGLEGFATTGACPILLLVFTLLFAIVQAAALILEFKILNRVTLIPAEEETAN